MKSAEMTRIGISTRVSGLAAALGLAASARVVPLVSGSFLLLCAIAALASIPQPTETARRIGPIIEGALVGLTLAIGGVISQPVGLYLAVPALMAGLLGGTVILAATLGAEVATMGAVAVVGQQSGTLPTTLRDALAWVLAGVGIGLLGSWIRRLRSNPSDMDHEEYVAAHRLLHELRVVSRRLSSGLDPVVLSTTLLDDCLALVTDGRGAILVRSHGGRFVSLAERLDGHRGDVVNDPVVLNCWLTTESAHKVADPEGANRTVRHETGIHRAASVEPTRWALPLRVGTRMVGVLVLDIGQPPGIELLAQLRALLDERALPLDTAMLFDEVRTLATVEERRRLAREIHDGVAQEIASLGYLVDDLAFAPDATRTLQVEQLRKELTRIVDDLRLSIFDLRSQVSRGSGLGSVLGDSLRELGLRSGTAIHLTLDETPDRLRLEVEEQLLRIVQEAVTNARKHSGAHNLWVTCRVRPPSALLIVEDDGSGEWDVEQSAGFGMSIMRERAQRIEATLSVTRSDHGGTRVEVCLPGPVITDRALGGAPATRTYKDHAKETIYHG